MRNRSTRLRNALIATAAFGLAVTGAGALGPVPGSASSHREAPLIAGQPRLDNTDLYAFVAKDAPDTVTFVANWTPFEEPNGGPNFYPFGAATAHDINIDNDGDAKPDVIYRWEFSSFYRNKNTFLYNTGPVTSLTDADLNFYQLYTLKKITKNGTTTLLSKAKVAPSFTGAASMPDYAGLATEAVTTIPGGGKSYAGQADDPFFLDLRVFDLLYGGNLSETGHDTLSGYNVNSIVLQVPKAEVALKGDLSRNPVIGVWTTTSRPSVKVTSGDKLAGKLSQVSRLGMPLVNEVVIPVGRKNEFNSTAPVDDAKFLPYVTDPEVPRLVQAIYGIPAPATPRTDLVEVFLTGVCTACGPVAADLNSQLLNKDVQAKKFKPSEQLRLNLGVAPSASENRMGVLGGDLAGFPNGRRLADDVIDITLQAAEGILIGATGVDGLGDGVNTNDHPFQASFPYVALPNQNAVNQ